jgi:hypothetical protein
MLAADAPFLPCPPLGTPLPPHSEHAVSVAMPFWRDVIGYEVIWLFCDIDGFFLNFHFARLFI